jgi:hypothetical protein
MRAPYAVKENPSTQPRRSSFSIHLEVYFNLGMVTKAVILSSSLSSQSEVAYQASVSSLIYPLNETY